jgi:hypothetical protein
MRRPGGYAAISDPERPIKECDTFTCCHCNTVVFVTGPVDDMGGFCTLCMKHTCKDCNAKGTCSPFEKKIERMERRDRLRRAAGV